MIKKVSFIVSVVVFVFSSCSKSDDPAPTADPSVVATNILLKRVITSQGGVVANTDNITYNGNKLIELVGTNGDKTTYAYTGDLITKIEDFESNAINTSETLTYNADGKLASSVIIDYNPVIGFTPTGFKVIYTYDASGNILFTAFTGNTTIQTTQSRTGKATFTNGSITKIENFYPANPLGAAAYTQTQTIIYDDKINTGNNITGFYKVTMGGTDIGLAGGIHNVLKETTSNGTYITSTDESTFTYNSNNYPVSEININKSFNANGTISSTITLNNQYIY